MLNLNDEETSAMFWVDETRKENYSKFSDVISMDATYRTNMYNMIFVPFTAINNHEKTINVGAGLISDETIESYSWLLKAFLSAYTKKTTMILIDMDPTLTSSISKELQGCTHRLCMWHIMSKMPSKIKPDVVSNSNFKKHTSIIVNGFQECTIVYKEIKSGKRPEFKELSVNCGKDVASKPNSNQIKEVENGIGLHIVDDIKIKVPSGIKIKGNGKRNIIKSVAEKAIAKSQSSQNHLNSLKVVKSRSCLPPVP
uniref:MULE transposase domain-containing protein n=1 Tax=Lactuca sativa TaxID=4236 RepID=A0A9R1VQY5_LACSA|nr:hypothetical protein LSAT_V11C400163790 [Lactuca sativa]